MLASTKRPVKLITINLFMLANILMIKNYSSSARTMYALKFEPS